MNERKKKEERKSIAVRITNRKCKFKELSNRKKHISHKRVVIHKPSKPFLLLFGIFY